MSALPMLLAAAQFDDYLADLPTYRAGALTGNAAPTAIDEGHWAALLADPDAEAEPLDAPVEQCWWPNGCRVEAPIDELVDHLCPRHAWAAAEEAEEILGDAVRREPRRYRSFDPQHGDGLIEGDEA